MAGLPECRVLIVEDERENQKLLKYLLERAGFQVRIAQDGAQGVESFQRMAAALYLDGFADARDERVRCRAAYSGS